MDEKVEFSKWIGRLRQADCRSATVQNQATADQRIPSLLQENAVFRCVVIKPLLGPVDLSKWSQCPECRIEGEPAGRAVTSPEWAYFCGRGEICPLFHWVVIYGESGSNARPCRIEWVRDLVRHCREAGVPVFVKQLGSRPIIESFDHGDCGIDGFDAVDFVEDSGGVRPLGLHPKHADPEEWPEDLRVREFPAPRK